MSNTEPIAAALRAESKDMIILGGDLVDFRIADTLERVADRIEREAKK